MINLPKIHWDNKMSFLKILFQTLCWSVPSAGRLLVPAMEKTVMEELWVHLLVRIRGTYFSISLSSRKVCKISLVSFVF